jgi:hypothetical protein
MKKYGKRLATVIADRCLPPQEHFDFCFLQRPVSLRLFLQGKGRLPSCRKGHM